MTVEPRRIDLEDLAGNLQQVFEQVRMHDQTVLVERNGRLHRIEKCAGNGPWDGYDPEKARQGLRTAVGALADVDTERLLEDIHAEREQDSRGREEPVSPRRVR